MSYFFQREHLASQKQHGPGPEQELDGSALRVLRLLRGFQFFMHIKGKMMVALLPSLIDSPSIWTKKKLWSQCIPLLLTFLRQWQRLAESSQQSG